MKIIIFDLAEVVIDGIIGIEKILAERFGSDPDTVNNILLNESMQEFFLGRITEDEYLGNIIFKYGWDISLEDLKEMIRAHFKPVKGTTELIREIRSHNKGIKIVLLSVHAVEWIKHCKSIFGDIFALFDEEFFSYAYGTLKPNPEAYWQVLNKYGLSPQEALFIDDSQRNINAAATLGIDTIRFTNAEALRRELVGRGLVSL